MGVSGEALRKITNESIEEPVDINWNRSKFIIASNYCPTIYKEILISKDYREKRPGLQHGGR